MRQAWQLAVGLWYRARGRNLFGLNLSDLSLDGSDFRDVDLTGVLIWVDVFA